MLTYVCNATIFLSSISGDEAITRNVEFRFAIKPACNFLDHSLILLIFGSSVANTLSL